MQYKSQHIILISLDTFRADCINSSPRSGAYKSKHNDTVPLAPTVLDELLKSSVYYNNCISAAPYTSASHGAYFTGIGPLHNGLYEFFNRRLKKPTIFQLAKKQGYRSIFQTDFPIMLGPYLGISDDVDSYHIEDEEAAFKELERNGKNKTLSFFHFGGIHYPYGFHTLKFGGDAYRKKVASLEKKYGIAKYQKTKLDDVLDETFRSKEDSQLLLRYKFIVQKLYKEQKYDDLFNLYLEGINYFMKHRFDKFLKKILNFMDKNNAVLILFSDHGEEWDSRSEGHHNSTDDNVLRVPLIVYRKGITPRIENSLVRTVDLAPTVLNELPNPSVPAEIEGEKLNYFSALLPNQKLHAISQVWTSIATKREISSYQKAAIKHKRSSAPLKTFLNAEVARNSRIKLTRYYDRKGATVSSTIDVSTKSNVIKKTAMSTLTKVLKKYNAKKLAVKKISSIEARLREEFSNLGYRV